MSHSTTSFPQQRNDHVVRTAVPQTDAFARIEAIQLTEQRTLLQTHSSTSRRISSTRRVSPLGYPPERERLLQETPTGSRPADIGVSKTPSIDSRPPKTANVTVSSVSKEENSDAVPSQQLRPMLPGGWLPYTLRRAFLGALASVSLTLSITLAILCWHSAHNDGLGGDDGSTSLLVAWRYTPTIAAVLFTQAIVMIFDDVTRTEPFSRLANPDHTDPKHSLLYRPKVWWKTIWEGFSRSRNGGRVGWVLAFSSLATGLSLLALTTLSSSLLVTEQVILHSVVDLKRFAATQDGSIPLAPRRETYFHTTSGFAYNTSTSMWVSDSYVVLPFGVTGLQNQSHFLPEGIWEAETRVFQMESACVPASLTEMISFNQSYIYEWDNLTYTYNSAIFDENAPVVNDTRTRTFRGFSLHSEECDIEVYTNPELISDIVDEGGLLWTNLSASYISWQQFAKQHEGMPFVSDFKWSPLQGTVLLEFSETCFGRDLLLMTSPWRKINDASYDFWVDFQLQAHICTPIYYGATMLANAAVSTGTRQVIFDENEYKKRRAQVGKDVLDTERLEYLALYGNRPGYLSRASIYRGYQGFVGLTEALLSQFSFNQTALLGNDTIAAQAARLRRRFFGELVYSSVVMQDSPALESITGQHTSEETRVVVVTEVAVVLSILLLCLACYLFGMLWGASLRRRPLNLSLDPSTTLGVAALLKHCPPATSRPGLMGEACKTPNQQIVELQTFSASDNNYGRGVLIEEMFAAVMPKPLATSNDWRPRVLRTIPLLILLVLLALVAAALLVLQNFADKQQLYHSAFVYQVDIGVFEAKFSPHSVIVTLTAVGLALWWDAVDKHMRVLQPTLSMARRPTPISRGAGLSYQSSYWAWAAAKAASNRHWLLFLVTIGTTLSQVLIISMAAIFEREPGILTRSNPIDRAYVTRQDPLSYQHGASTVGNPLQDIMMSVTGDWMYSALDQMTLQAAPPAWSQDGWSFMPVDLKSLPDISMRQNTGDLDDQSQDSTLLNSSSKVSFVTSARRGRLQCESVPTDDGTWLNRNEVEILEKELNGTVRNVTGNLNITDYILPRSIFVNTTHETTIFTTPSRILCCANEAGDSKRSAVAYWSHMKADEWWSYLTSSWTGVVPDDWPGNFTVKWILGPTKTTNFTIYTNNMPSTYTMMQFTEIPAMQILNCKPMIEQADAHVTVARSSGQVLNFTLSGEPQPQSDVWSLGFNVTSSDISETKGEVHRQVHPRQIVAPGGSPSDLSRQNYTARLGYGSYFMTQLLAAASIADMSMGNSDLLRFERLEDERYNIRDRALGLNMDFMSYSNYFLANKDPMALLNPETLLNYSQQTFQTFFQHFSSQTKWTDGQPIAYERLNAADAKQVDVTTTERIEILTMVESATWICLAILFILMLILITLMVSLKIIYPRTMMLRNVECLADKLAIVVGSQELLEQVDRYGVDDLRKSAVRTRLSWFRDKKGIVRWGIELADAYSVEWVQKPERINTGELVRSVTRSLE